MTDTDPMSEPTQTTTSGAPINERSWRAPLLLAVLFLAMTLPVILSGRGGPSEASDQDEHHLVVIEQFRQQLPSLDIVDYPSATSPGYHAALAMVAKVVGPQHDVLVMRLVNCLVGLGFVLVCWWVASWYISRWSAMLLTLPLSMSAYVLGSAIFLTTDTAALFFVLLALTGVMMERVSAGRIVLCGLAGACAVGIRQIHLWVAGPVGIVGLLTSPLASIVPKLMRDREGDERRWSNLGASVAGALFPMGLMAWLVWKWGGLMPPVYVDIHNTGTNPATFAFALGLIGLFGVWFLPLVVETPRAVLRDRLVWIAMGLGALAAILVETSFQDRERAYGPLWRLVRAFPEVGERSLVILLASMLGAIVMVLLYRGAERNGHGRRAFVLMLCVLGWLLAQSFNSMAWQRYFEPLALVWIAWLIALAQPSLMRQRWRWGGVALVGLVQICLSLASLYREVITLG